MNVYDSDILTIVHIFISAKLHATMRLRPPYVAFLIHFFLPCHVTVEGSKSRAREHYIKKFIKKKKHIRLSSFLKKTWSQSLFSHSTLGKSHGISVISQKYSHFC